MVSGSHPHSTVFCQYVARRGVCNILSGLGGLEYLEHGGLHAFALNGGPCARVRTQSAHEVVDALSCLVPVYAACLLENLGSHGQVVALLLGNGRSRSIAFDNLFDGLQADVGTEMHQSVVDIFHIGIVWNVHAFVHDDASCVDVMIQEEGCHTRFCFAIDDSPVDGSCTAVFRQQGGMHIKCAVLGHAPYHFGQHAERHDYLEVGAPSFKLLEKNRIFHLHGLQNG